MSFITVLLVLILTVGTQRRSGWSPAVLGAAVWVFVCLFCWMGLLGLLEVGQKAQAIIVVGVAMTLLPSLVSTLAVTDGQSKVAIDGRKLALWTVIAGMMTAVGAWYFQTQIGAAVGADFANLTPEQIRRAQTSDTRGGGALGLLLATAPLLGCLSLLGIQQRNRLYLVPVAGAFLALYQNPSRTVILSLVVTMAIFYFYTRRIAFEGSTKIKIEMNRATRYALALGGGIMLIAIFIVIGDSLGKNEAAQQMYADSRVPTFLTSPLLYLMGGASALTVVTDYGATPYASRGATTYILARLWSMFDSSYQAPETIAGYVSIPEPFNVYTGYGHLWIDWGWLGLILLSTALGLTAWYSHKFAMLGSLPAAWVSASVAAVFMSMPLDFRLLNLDVVTAAAVGYIALRSITSRSSGQAAGSAASPGTTSGKSTSGLPVSANVRRSVPKEGQI